MMQIRGSLDLIECTAKRDERVIDLLPREFRLLEYMMRRKEQMLKLLEEVWNYKFVPQTNLVDVHMGRLRRKVDEPNEPTMINNVRGIGFILPCPYLISFARRPFAGRSPSPALSRSTSLLCSQGSTGGRTST
jgi:DNA-binding winged helix-turn-helix (wHTH) protein